MRLATMRNAKLVGALALAGVLAAGIAYAQQLSPDAARAMSRTDAATAQLDRGMTCLRDKRERLVRFSQLIHEADTQARMQTGRAHDDAVTAIVSLERQAADVDRQARRCVGNEPSPFPAEVTQAPTTHIDPPRDPTSDHVAVAAGSNHVVEHDAPLTDYVRIATGEQVDGLGHVSDEAVRSGVHALAGRLAACYDHMVEHGALRSGQMSLVFTIDAGGGGAHRVAVEGDTLGDSSLRRCVQDAGQHLHFSQAAYGGMATFSYALRFGAD